MKKQVYNPILPLDTYICDTEAHVFGDRVYLFGSHDKGGGDTYCMLDYEIWSAPIDDLSDWSSKGANYSASQDPLADKTNRHYPYAPDCVRGNDGRYYLYYCLGGYRGNGGYHGPVSVAVCDTPDGKYEFYGHVHFADGTLCKKYVPFDPAVINDNGVIRLYYGSWYPFDEMSAIFRPIMRRVQAGMFNKTVKEIKAEKGGVMGAVTMTLEDDMLTIKELPKRILPVKTRGTPFESGLSPLGKNGHFLYGKGFFEACCIRKIEDKYYFIYSSVDNHNLCYCTSKYPDRDFTFGGVIVSNGDVGFEGRKEKDRLNHTATTHGSIEKINGEWYVFYHKQTHGTDYSRQVCAEKIQILSDGSIPQVEMSSCGLNGKPLEGKGVYSASICCNLTNGKMPHGGNRVFKGMPRIDDENGVQYLAELKKGTVANYKYFDLSETTSITVCLRGKGKLQIAVNDKLCGEIEINSTAWQKQTVALKGQKSVLSFKVISGRLDILSFELTI